jgi:hypothetical protein
MASNDRFKGSSAVGDYFFAPGGLAALNSVQQHSKHIRLSSCSPLNIHIPSFFVDRHINIIPFQRSSLNAHLLLCAGAAAAGHPQRVGLKET